ncbi:RDD family protein [Cellulomonas gilvus]|uniref:RDD domain containing protein n=1 Tax=Cellulomonas gilvus (strain ATCC 13127 / NRRL B-14078) TaxID=593907 RepID=F7ZZ05_CELGA|nr:RDD family protein [Cellulomonas gilvus]AEI11273.1 RDD domain containing protein [Cellulomonas gilvus ATCC 13127]
MSSPTPCTTCGQPLREGARFCTACGAPVTPVLVVEAQPSRRSRAATGRASGRPRPAPPVPAPAPALGAAFDGAPTVGVGRRLLAYLIDAAVVAAVAGGVLVATGHVFYGALAAAELALGIVVWEARTGRTFGNLALGLRAARAESPYAPGLGRGAARSLVMLAGHAVGGVGQLVVVGSVGFDRGPLRQGWHDRAGRAVVVDVRAPRGGAGAAVAPHVQGVPAPFIPTGPQPSAVAAPAVAPAVAPPPPPAGAPVPATTQAPAPAVARTYVLTLDTGEAMTVSGPGVIGRAPRPRPGERCDHVVVVDDPERSLSRTHARFGVDGRGFWVADAGSGNGTLVVLPTGQTLVVAEDRPTPVPAGATVRIGDRSVLVDPLPGS